MTRKKFSKALSALLKKEREQRNEPVSQVAKNTKILVNSVYYMESGKKVFSTYLLYRLWKFYGFDLNALFSKLVEIDK